MRTEFRRASLPEDLRRLVTFDRKVFPRGDWFDGWYWKQVESWWMLVDDVRVGCCAFAVEESTLHIVSTGILPKYQRRGFGTLMKAWQVCYARQHGFERIETTTRRRNEAMIRLNRKFRFRSIGSKPGYYSDPPDAAVVMELKLKR